MSDTSKILHPVADANDHAKQQGDGSRPPLPPQQATRPVMRRRIPVKVRAPFLPEHHGHARHGLKGETS